MKRASSLPILSGVIYISDAELQPSDVNNAIPADYVGPARQVGNKYHYIKMMFRGRLVLLVPGSFPAA